MAHAAWHSAGLDAHDRWPLRARRDPESRSRACTDLFLSRAGKVWTVYELTCFLSPFVVDVVLTVTMQRQALAVLFVLTEEVPQVQFFDDVGFRFLGMWVYIDKSSMCPWSCKGRCHLLSGASKVVGEFHTFLTRALALFALGPWTLFLRARCIWLALGPVSRC